MADVTLSTALKEILPLPDSAGNDHMSDVIGNKDDTSAGSSIISILKYAAEVAIAAAAEVASVEEHLHAQARVYPTLAAGALVAAPAGAWTLGDEVEIIPVGAIASNFSLTFLNIEAVSANDVFEIVIYNDAELARQRVSKISNQTGVPSVPITSIVQPAGTRISARVACGLGGASTVRLSLCYHIHTG